MRIYYLICLFIFSSELRAMESGRQTAKIFHFYSSAIKTIVPVKDVSLATILPASECGSHGVVTSLIARRQNGVRTHENTLLITQSGIQRSSRKLDLIEPRPVDAITLMRDDVSRALGGPYVLGDDIHVAGLDLGATTLKNGAIIVIKDPEDQQVKVVLLKTMVEYCANAKLLNRCGEHAYDFLQGTGIYTVNLETGFKPVDGLRDRLRGVKLAVLQEGKVALGDCISIYDLEESKKLIESKGLIEIVDDLMERSGAIAEQNAIQNERERFDEYVKGRPRDPSQSLFTSLPWRDLAYGGSVLATLLFICLNAVLKT